jgi:hypothetical protein
MSRICIIGETMQLNLIGLVSAMAAFLSIWWSHVAVRKIEAVSQRLWPPMLGAMLLGFVVLSFSVRSVNPYLTAVLGITGVVFLWDAFEFYRQAERVKQGRAPANPRNPRHNRILTKHPEATVIDWLDRDPRGRPYSEAELEAIKASVR